MISTYQIIVPTPLARAFSYSYGGELALGQLVMAPFRNRALVGYVDQSEQATFEGKLKTLERLLPYRLTDENRTFIKWCADYTLTPSGMVFKMMCPFDQKDFAKMEKDPVFVKIGSVPTTQTTLNQDQTTARDTILGNDGFQAYLLDGLTGSGKTEVYFDVIAEHLKENQQVLVMLPEISLTSQFLERFYKRFGFKPLLWHSTLTPKTRRLTFKHVVEGVSTVVVGTRSALFLPFQQLGLIVVDEEHDASYKQEEQVIYNGRDLALVRAKLNNVPIILSSATPSIETYQNVMQGKYHHLTLTERYGDAVLPDVALIDFKKYKPQNGIHYITTDLQKEIQGTLSRGEQALLFLNRRGYAPILLCADCGERFMCKTCSTNLVYHKNKAQLSCHHCDFFMAAPKQCPKCASENLKPFGPGVERVAEEIKMIFPDARVLVVVSDQLHSQKSYDALFQEITDRRVDIIIGTQIMAKGHNFSHITLIGVIDADMGLNGIDLRASEKTFQLLHQVAGRAGRAHLKGRVVIQTHHPDHAVMQALQHHDRDAFLKLETEQRSLFEMPPFARLALVELSGINQNLLQHTAHHLNSAIPHDERVMVMGPTPPPLATVRGRHRLRFLLKSKKTFPLQQWIKLWLEDFKIPPQIRLKIDIDPQDFS